MTNLPYEASRNPPQLTQHSAAFHENSAELRGCDWLRGELRYASYFLANPTRRLRNVATKKTVTLSLLHARGLLPCQFTGRALFLLEITILSKSEWNVVKNENICENKQHWFKLSKHKLMFTQVHSVLLHFTQFHSKSSRNVTQCYSNSQTSSRNDETAVGWRCSNHTAKIPQNSTKFE